MFKNHFVKLEGRAQRKEDARALTENRNAVRIQRILIPIPKFDGGKLEVYNNPEGLNLDIPVLRHLPAPRPFTELLSCPELHVHYAHYFHIHYLS